jgi:arginine/ornithine N-succinyltransferase beta subunit
MLQYKLPPDCSNVGQFTKKLISLMKTVMRRNGRGPHWTEELEEFYELAEGKDGQKNI